MELGVHISSSFGSLFPNYSTLTAYREIKFGFQGRSSSITCRSNDHQSLVLSEKEVQQQQLWSNQREMDLDDGDEMEFDDASSFLSLSEKPDRNMASPDDYEIEELDYASHPNHKSGYVAVLGKPNVGKSTLANQMIGQKLSIVTNKPQTTRHRILGICSGPEYQMILYDTPGVIEKKIHMLDSMMMKNVRSAGINADCIVVLVDACKAPERIDEILEEGVGDHKDKLPILLVLNKKDLIKPGEIAKKLEWYEKFTDVDEVIPVSAKYGHGVEDIRDWILTKLPLGPAYYPKVCQSPRFEILDTIFGYYLSLLYQPYAINLMFEISRMI